MKRNPTSVTLFGISDTPFYEDEEIQIDLASYCSDESRRDCTSFLCASNFFVKNFMRLVSSRKFMLKRHIMMTLKRIVIRSERVHGKRSQLT